MMNIVMSANDYVYCGVELVIYSTLTHNKNINWYIFTMNVAIRDDAGNYKAYKGLNDRQQEKLRKIVKYLDKNSNITFIDCAPFYQKHLEGSVNEQSDFTPYATLRLIMDKALPYVNETLYFDCDVGVMGNFESMYRDCAQQKSESCFAVYADDANQRAPKQRHTVGRLGNGGDVILQPLIGESLPNGAEAMGEQLVGAQGQFAADGEDL